MSAAIPNPCRCGAHPTHPHRCKPETPEQAEAREAQLVLAYCHCWGLVKVVAWEVGTTCSRCGCTWISEAEYRRRLARLTPRRRRQQPMHQRPVATVSTGGAL